mmetsp:Transcript_23396/g.35582  ORF Transcript_23396/g.35582 Transcript_23396/m.35582 type:complete len:150 (-) Transcript_23396:204-653(-)
MPPTADATTVVFRFPVTRDNVRMSCFAPIVSAVKKVPKVAICPTLSNLFRRLIPRNVISRFCNMAIVLGEKILGASLLNMESTIKGTTNVKTPSSPGLSNSRDISTSALDSAARCWENKWVASFIVLVLSIDCFRICTSCKALLAPSPK